MDSQSITGLISQRQFVPKCQFLASRPLGCCSFQNILTNPIISQINTSLLPYFISQYSSAFTTRTPKCTLRSVLSVLNMMSFFILLAPSVFFHTSIINSRPDSLKPAKEEVRTRAISLFFSALSVRVFLLYEID